MSDVSHWNKHFENMMTNLQFDIVSTTCMTFVWYMAIGTAIFEFCLHRSELDPQGTFKFFTDMSHTERIYYCSIYTSTINCIIVFVIANYATFLCEPPVEYQRNDILLGNTGYRNEWCMDNTTNFDILIMSYFTGYMLYEFVNVVFFIGDFKSNTAREDIMHHVLGLTAAISCTIGGGYVLSGYRLSAIIELSTIFNNIRILLTKHNYKDGRIYFYNGLFLTLTFLIVRGFCYGWLLFGCLFPAI
jgi:hypothetical protein